MSLYNIALVTFFFAIGLLFLFDFGRVVQVIAGISALVCGVLLLVEGNRTISR